MQPGHRAGGPPERRARGSGRTFRGRDHPVVGPTRIPRHPTRFSAAAAELGAPAPQLGEHTDEVLAELGLAARIAGLRARGVVG